LYTWLNLKSRVFAIRIIPGVKPVTVITAGSIWKPGNWKTPILKSRILFNNYILLKEG
jgi:hypothetical protein